MPPIPPKAIVTAVETARFEWETMLLACCSEESGTHEKSERGRGKTYVGQDARHTSRSSCIGKEETKVAGTVGFCVSRNDKANHCNTGLNNEPWRPFLSLVAKGSKEETRNSSNHVRRRCKDKSHGGRITHRVKDDRDEETNGVGGHGGAHEHESICPESPVRKMGEDFLQCDLVGDGIATVPFNTIKDHLHWV